jgi:hypothetical protein
MTKTLKASSIRPDQKTQRYLLELKFAPPSNTNLLERLVTYSGVFSSQEKFSESKIVAKLHETINELNERIANNSEEHELVLQKYYSKLKMQPRYIEESDDKFQERLSQQVNKVIPSNDKESPWLTYVKNAYLYLSKYAFYPKINSVYDPNSGTLETESSSMRLTK